MRASVSAALSQAYGSRDRARDAAAQQPGAAPRERTPWRGDVAARGPRRDADGRWPRSAARLGADARDDEPDREPELGRTPRVRAGDALARRRNDLALDGRRDADICDRLRENGRVPRLAHVERFFVALAVQLSETGAAGADEERARDAGGSPRLRGTAAKSRALVVLLPSPSSDALERREELVPGGLMLGTLVLSEEAEGDVAGGLVDLPLLKEPVDLDGAVPHGDLELARELLQRRGERVEDSRRSGLLEPDLFRERLEVLDVLAVVILLREVLRHQQPLPCCDRWAIHNRFRTLARRLSPRLETKPACAVAFGGALVSAGDGWHDEYLGADPSTASARISARAQNWPARSFLISSIVRSRPGSCTCPAALPARNRLIRSPLPPCRESSASRAGLTAGSGERKAGRRALPEERAARYRSSAGVRSDGRLPSMLRRPP